MKTTADYLDDLRARFGATSDGQLMAPTGWARQMISRYRCNRTSFDDDTAERVAGWLKVPLAQVLIDMNAQRAKSENVKKAWLSVAAVLVLAVIGADPGALLSPAAADASSVYYVKSCHLFVRPTSAHCLWPDLPDRPAALSAPAYVDEPG